VFPREYTVDERLPLDVTVEHGGHLVARSWALNEATVEKGVRERMLEVRVDVDGRPLSRYGCDGVVLATPTGSTAYAFSSGGPVVWPGVEALLLVPPRPPPLVARPLAGAPTSVPAVELLPDARGGAVVWCDGRRSIELPPGGRVEVRRSAPKVRLGGVAPAPVPHPLGG